jgi:hypothetical protein
MTLIIGSNGSMGRRYQAILKHLEVPFECYDIGTGTQDWSRFDNFILATPTDLHFRYVKNLEVFKKPILCEKPLSTDHSEFVRILDASCPISMMMQYAYFDRDYAHGKTKYDFYNHGKDGLVWDCFQIIALARGEVEVKESSPIWHCTLNGQEIDLKQMDRAYVWAVRRFLDGIYIPKEKLLEYHLKVKSYEEKWRSTQLSA